MFHWTAHLEEVPSKGHCHAAVAVGDKLYSFGGSSKGNNGDQ
ncbi:hypothetical protein, partial [Nocardioides malaquae]